MNLLGFELGFDLILQVIIFGAMVAIALIKEKDYLMYSALIYLILYLAPTAIECLYVYMQKLD